LVVTTNSKRVGMKNKALFIGIDIGGTNTVIGLVDANGHFLKQKTFPTRAQEPFPLFFRKVEYEIARLTNGQKDELAGIGIGAPSVNNKFGYIDNAKNFTWGRVDLTRMFSDRFKLPVKLINDADAAALGEMYFGAARDLKNFIHITLGTGLGSSIVFNKQLMAGEYGFAGELGHTKVDSGNRLCSCGKRGCLETYVSASGICRTAFELLSSERFETQLKHYSFDRLTPEIISELAKQGDTLAIETFKYTGKVLGQKLADVVALLNPEAIVFSGGLTGAGDFLFKPTKEAMEKNLLQIHKNTVEIRISDSRINYAVLGSAALIIKELN